MSDSKSVGKACAARSRPTRADVCVDRGFESPATAGHSSRSTTAFACLHSSRLIRLPSSRATEKTSPPSFPKSSKHSRRSPTRRKSQFVLDGEIVALIDGDPGSISGVAEPRMHVQESHMIERYRTANPAAIVLFDILMADTDVLVREPWSKRRARLLKDFEKVASDVVRITDSIEGDGAKMLAQAEKQGWEGVIAKRVDSIYEPGVRSRAWLKLKVEFRQEFVVGGYTEPRNSRQHIGALLLGYYDRGRLIYVGHTGGGFTGDDLVAMYQATQAARTGQVTIRGNTEDERARTLGETENRRRGEIQSSGPATENFASQSTLALVTTSLRRKLDARDHSMQKRKTATAKAPVAKKTSKSTARRRIYAKRTLEDDGAAYIRRKRKSKVHIRGRLLRSSMKFRIGSGSGRLEISKGVSLDVTNLGKEFFPNPQAHQRRSDSLLHDRFALHPARDG